MKLSILLTSLLACASMAEQPGFDATCAKICMAASSPRGGSSGSSKSSKSSRKLKSDNDVKIAEAVPFGPPGSDIYCSSRCDAGDVVYHEFQGVSMVTCIDYFGPWVEGGDYTDDDEFDYFEWLNNVEEEALFKDMEETQIDVLGSVCSDGDADGSGIIEWMRKNLGEDDEQDQQKACEEAVAQATQAIENYILEENWDDFKYLTKKTFMTLAKVAITGKFKFVGAKSKLFDQMLDFVLGEIIDAVLEGAKEYIQQHEGKDDLIAEICNIDNFNIDNAAQVVRTTYASYNEALPTADEGGGWCFGGSSELQMEEGDTKQFRDVKVGDRILTAGASGGLSFSPVVFLPHKKNVLEAQFLQVVTKSGKNLRATRAHMIQACDGSLIQASSLAPDRCLRTVDGNDEVESVQVVVGVGVYTAVTLGGDYLVVDGVVASPFASQGKLPTALTHRLAQGFYNVHRVLYLTMPSWWVVESRPVALFSDMSRAFAFAAVSKYGTMYNAVMEALPATG